MNLKKSDKDFSVKGQKYVSPLVKFFKEIAYVTTVILTR